MLGATPIAAVLGAAPEPTADLDTLKSFVRAACGQGLALLLIAPGAKVPVDMRTSRQRSADDEAAQRQAKAQGRLDWRKVRSLAGAHLATTDAATVTKYLTEYRKRYGAGCAVNFAVEVGRSGLIVVDADTTAQVTAFVSDAAAERAGTPPEDVTLDTAPPPTVRTPGSQDDDGRWVHENGGHYYFTVPDGVELPGTGTWTAPGGYVAMYRGRYVLIPPSRRPEGDYRLSGREYPAPDWLIEAVSASGRSRDAAAARPAPGEDGADLADAVDAWAQRTSWSDILEPHGWTLTARPDRCGCDIWTAPGDHGSPKSATTHDTGCTLHRYTPDNAPMHIWTDHPGEGFEAWISERGSSTLSKLQAIAITEYGGDVGTAAAELDLIPGGEAIERDTGVSASNLPTATDDFAAPAPDPTEAGPDPEALTAPGDEDESLEPDYEKVLYAKENGVPRIAPFDHWRNTPAPTWAIEGIIEHKAMSMVIGPPGAGKSAVALDMACALVSGQHWQGRKVIRQKVLYLPGEGMSGAVQRVLAWESAYGIDVGQDLLLGDSIIQLGASSEAWKELAAYITRHRVGLIIFDTFARMSLGIEENSATDVGKAVTRFDQIRRITDAGVMIVHHTGKNSTSARGSSALWGSVESQLLVEPGTWDASGLDGKPIDMTIQKQKNGEETEDPIPMLLASMHDSIVVTGPSGEVGDPLAHVAEAPMVMAEPAVETAVRIRELIDKYPQQGLTRTDVVKFLRPDDHTLAQRDPDLIWRQKATAAVDLALRYSLIETLTGTASGSRYVPSTTTPDQARRRAADEALGD